MGVGFRIAYGAFGEKVAWIPCSSLLAEGERAGCPNFCKLLLFPRKSCLAKGTALTSLSKEISRMIADPCNIIVSTLI